MAKLTEGHIEQIKSMKEDGKKGPEIIAFFQDTYKIRLDASEISRAVHDKYSKGVATDSINKPRRRAAQRRYAARIKKSKGPKETRQDPPPVEDTVVSHIRLAWLEYKKKFLREVEGIINNA